MYANKVKKIAAVHDLSGMGRVSLTVVIPIPVSYTHLDVYKRQVLFTISCGSFFDGSNLYSMYFSETKRW